MKIVAALLLIAAVAYARPGSRVAKSDDEAGVNIFMDLVKLCIRLEEESNGDKRTWDAVFGLFSDVCEGLKKVTEDEMEETVSDTVKRGKPSRGGDDDDDDVDDMPLPTGDPRPKKPKGDGGVDPRPKRPMKDNDEMEEFVSDLLKRGKPSRGGDDDDDDDMPLPTGDPRPKMPKDEMEEFVSDLLKRGKPSRGGDDDNEDDDDMPLPTGDPRPKRPKGDGGVKPTGDPRPKRPRKDNKDDDDDDKRTADLSPLKGGDEASPKDQLLKICVDMIALAEAENSEKRSQDELEEVLKGMEDVCLAAFIEAENDSK